ncbi:MAG: NAD(P)/FAD-dependent oxidoreductase [Thermoplasmata archaeon]|nr:FAD/NAD(P)-binding oxidoreductase [Thermoplasmata archaeon]
MKKVLIIGAGGGGLILANSLDTDKYDVTLIDRDIYHYYQPWFLYMAFNGSKRKIWRKIDSLIKPGITFKNEEVTEIDLDNRAVKTNKDNHTYDYLIIGTGTNPDPSVIPGLEEINNEYGNYHSSVENANKLWNKIKDFKSGTAVLVQASPTCKCPPSPVEGMLLLEEYLNKNGLKEKTKLVFATPYPRPYPAEPMNRIVEPIMKERGIDLITFFNMESVDPKNKVINSMEGDSINYDLPIIIPPCRGAKINYKQENVIDDDRFIKADKYTMKILGYDDAFAIGDCNNLPTSKSGVTAHLQAKVVADIIDGKDSKFDGRINCPFDMAYGKGTFVIADYNHPVVPYPPTEFKHFMKISMADIYWWTLRGYVDFVFDIFFEYTKPEKLIKMYQASEA